MEISRVETNIVFHRYKLQKNIPDRDVIQQINENQLLVLRTITDAETLDEKVEPNLLSVSRRVSEKIIAM